VKVGGRTIDAVCAETVRDADAFFASLQLSEKDAEIADKVLREIRKRLGFLRDVGLDYLTLDRLSSTLSGGESQRINLATSLGSALVDTLYVLDEPSIGLHSRDNERLILILRHDRRHGAGRRRTGRPRRLCRAAAGAPPGAPVADCQIPA
jgi:excinuclease ABC subunit A